MSSTIISLSIAAVSLIFGLYQWFTKNNKEDTAEQTTVIVKLEHIGSDVAEIKAEMKSIKSDIKEDNEEIITMRAEILNIKERMDTMWSRIDELRDMQQSE